MFQHLLFLLVLDAARSAGYDCPYKECTCSDQYIHCEQTHLTTMPALVPITGSYLALDLDSNSLTDIPAGRFPSNLTSIYFSENPITTIADTAFDSIASTLKILTFSSLNFTQIPDAFRHLKVLQSLDISSANIQDWNEPAMANIGQTLKILNLNNVGLDLWTSWFQYFSRLTDLSITGGSFLHSVTDVSLDNMTNSLVTLSISNTDLAFVPKAFSKFKVIQKLTLENNKITDVTWLPQASKLQRLSLSGNLISNAKNLSNALLPLKDSLNFFDGSSNRLSSFPNISFLTGVGTLDFSNNRMSDPYSGSVAPDIPGLILSNNFLPSLPHVLKMLQWIPEINMFYNSVKQLRASDFPNSTKMVELGNNLITELTDTSFPINSLISALNLNNNPIMTISIGAFKNLGQLTELDLQGTRLTRLPLALGSLTSTFFVDLSNSTNLICTCQEKGLADWVASLGYTSILGSCGLMDIVEFYSKLSPFC